MCKDIKHFILSITWDLWAKNEWYVMSRKKKLMCKSPCNFSKMNMIFFFNNTSIASEWPQIMDRQENVTLSRMRTFGFPVKVFRNLQVAMVIWKGKQVHICQKNRQQEILAENCWTFLGITSSFARPTSERVRINGLCRSSFCQFVNIRAAVQSNFSITK